MSDVLDPPLVLPQAFLDEMVAHAREDQPDECCGVIVRLDDGSLKLMRTTNEEASPFRFRIPAGELNHIFNKVGGELLVIYHSHTMTEARPSPTDLNFARMLQGPDPWPYWVVVSLAEEPPSVRAWRIEGADGETVIPVEIPLHAGALPPASVRVRLTTTLRDQKPAVVEAAIEG